MSKRFSWWEWGYLKNPRFYFDIIGPWTPFWAKHERVMKESPPPWGNRVFEASRGLRRKTVGKVWKHKEKADEKGNIGSESGTGTGRDSDSGL